VQLRAFSASNTGSEQDEKIGGKKSVRAVGIAGGDWG